MRHRGYDLLNHGPHTRLRAVPIPSLSDLELHEKDPGKQASNVRLDAYRFARLFGRDILRGLRDKDKTNMKDYVIRWGIAADKVLAGTESSGLTLSIPPQLVDKLVLAVQVKAKSAQVIDKPG